MLLSASRKQQKVLLGQQHWSDGRAALCSKVNSVKRLTPGHFFLKPWGALPSLWKREQRSPIPSRTRKVSLEQTLSIPGWKTLF